MDKIKFPPLIRVYPTLIPSFIFNMKLKTGETINQAIDRYYQEQRRIKIENILKKISNMNDLSTCKTYII
jgi:hypothetical protein